MARIKYNHNSFATGLIDKKNQANTDFEGYNNALDECTNFQIGQNGGCFKRKGSHFVAQTKNNAEARLILFTYSDNNSYICEFGDHYIRFFCFGSQENLEISTPFDLSEVKTLKYLQQNEIMFILSSLGIYTLTMINNVSLGSVTTSFELSDTPIEFSFIPLTFMNNVAVGLKASFDKALDISNLFTESFYVKAVNPKDDNNSPDQRFSPVFFPGDADINNKNYLVLTYSETEKYYLKILYVDSNSEEGASDNDETVVFNHVRCQIDRDLSNLPINTTNNKTGYDVARISTSLKSCCVNWQISAFNQERGMPKAIALYGNRLFLANTKSCPWGIWGSSLLYDDWFNFFSGNNPEDAIASKASLQISSNILWLASQAKLYIGTRSGIYIAESATYNEEAITPTNFRVRLLDTVGASGLDPLIASDAVFFVDSSERQVHMIRLSPETGNYHIEDVSALASSLFDSGIIAHAWQQRPIRTYWCAVEEGYLCALTYFKNMPPAWSKHVLSGRNAKVESLATMPYGAYDYVWMIVSREINGEIVRYLEYFEPQSNSLNEGEFQQFYVDSGVTKEIKYQIKDIQKSQNAHVECDMRLVEKNSIYNDQYVVVFKGVADSGTHPLLNYNSYIARNVTDKGFDIYKDCRNYEMLNSEYIKIDPLEWPNYNQSTRIKWSDGGGVFFKRTDILSIKQEGRRTVIECRDDLSDVIDGSKIIIQGSNVQAQIGQDKFLLDYNKIRLEDSFYSGEEIEGKTFKGGLLDIVKGTSNLMAIDKDGKVWNYLYPYFYSIVAADKLLVAGGRNIIMTSDDGIKWELAEVQFKGEYVIYHISYDDFNHYFIAVGDFNGINGILESSNGKLWVFKSFTGRYFVDKYTNGAFKFDFCILSSEIIKYRQPIMVGVGDGIILHFDINDPYWPGSVYKNIERLSDNTPVRLYATCSPFAGKDVVTQPIAVGDNIIMMFTYSYGKYDLQELTGYKLRGIGINSDGKFIAVGLEGKIVKGQYKSELGDANLLKGSFDIDDTEIKSPTGNDLYSVIYNEEENKFIAVGEKGTIIESSDGIKWDLIETSIGKINLRSIIVYSPQKRYYLLSDSGHMFTINFDFSDFKIQLDQWRELKQENSSVYYYQIAGNNSLLFVVGNYGNNNTNLMIYENDLVKYKSFNTLYNKAAVGNDSVIVFQTSKNKNSIDLLDLQSENSNKFALSYRGTAWAQFHFKACDFSDFKQILKIKGRYVCISDNNIYIQADSNEWMIAYSDTSLIIQKMITDDDDKKLIVIGYVYNDLNSNQECKCQILQFKIEYDSLKLYLENSYFPFDNIIPNDIVKLNTVYILVGKNSENNNGVIYVSNNLKSWTLVNEYKGEILNSIIPVSYDAEDHEFITVGNNGTIVKGSVILDATKGFNIKITFLKSNTVEDLQAIFWYPSIFISVGSGGIILSSKDMVNWNIVYSDISCTFMSVTCGSFADKDGNSQNTFVAVGKSDDVTARGVLVTSKDATHWIKSYYCTGLNNVIYDGSPQKDKDDNIIYCNGKFIAVGDYNTAISSTEGQVWQTLLDRLFNDVLYNDKLYIAVGDNNTIAVSSDGVVWNFRFEPLIGEEIYNLKKIRYGSIQNVESITSNDIYIVIAQPSNSATNSDSTTNITLISHDFISWNQVKSPEKYYVQDIVCSEDKIIGIFNEISPSGSQSEEAQKNQPAEVEYLKIGNDGSFTWQDPKGIDKPLNSVAYGNNTLVAVGNNSVVYSLKEKESDNAETESERKTLYFPSGNVFKKIVFRHTEPEKSEEGQLCILVGNKGLIYRSSSKKIEEYDKKTSSKTLNTETPDTETSNTDLWTECDTGVKLDFNDAVYAKGTFVVVGNKGIILTSNDAIKWENQYSGTVENLNKVIYVSEKELFIAIGSKSTIIYSNDGAKWDYGIIKNSAQIGNITDIQYFCSNKVTQFLAIGDRDQVEIGLPIITSSDGKTWYLRKLPCTKADKDFSVNLQKICTSGSAFIATGLESQEVGFASYYRPFSKSFFNLIIFITNLLLEGWNFFKADFSIEKITDIIFQNGSYIAVGNLGQRGIVAKSTDGRKWKITASIDNVNLIGIAFFEYYSKSENKNKSEYVVVDHGGKIFMNADIDKIFTTTPEKIEGPKINKILIENNQCFLFCNDYVYVYSNGCNEKNEVLKNWKAITTTFSSDLFKVNFLNNRFFALGSKGVVLISDGKNWVQTEGVDASSELININYLNNLYILNGIKHNLNVIWKSVDGITWKEYKTNAEQRINSITSANNNLVAVGENYNIKLSSDATNWEQQNKTTYYINNIVYVNERFVALCNFGYILVSKNGLTWSVRTTGSSASLYDLTYGNGWYVAVGSDETVIKSFDTRVWYNGDFIVYDHENNSEQKFTLISILYNNGIFLARSSENILSENILFASTDCVNWVQHSVKMDISTIRINDEVKTSTSYYLDCHQISYYLIGQGEKPASILDLNCYIGNSFKIEKKYNNKLEILTLNNRSIVLTDDIIEKTTQGAELFINIPLLNSIKFHIGTNTNIILEGHIPEEYIGDVYLSNVYGMKEISDKKYKIKNISYPNAGETNVVLYDYDKRLTEYIYGVIDSYEYSAFNDGTGKKGSLYLYFDTIEGLTHLQGEAITLCGDGNEVFTYEPKNVMQLLGLQKLKHPMMYCTAGLRIKSCMKTVPFSGGCVIGSSVGSVGSHKDIAIYIYKSLGGKYGSEADNLYPIIKEQTKVLFDTPQKTYTGLIKLPIVNGKDIYSRCVYLEHNDPFGFNVLSIVEDVRVSDG